MATMRAVRFHENGPPSVLRLEEVPIPEPGPGEARIRVRAAALNHLDLWVRRGIPIDLTMPHVGGSDLAGVVDRIGDDAEGEGRGGTAHGLVDPGAAAGKAGRPREGRFAVGDRVVVDPSLHWDWYARSAAGGDPRQDPLRLVGEHTDGGFAEYALVPVANLVRLPDHVSFEVAAAAALNFVTAWHALTSRGRLRRGERLLVTGASGGVSTAAVQLGRRLGAEVYAVTSGRENADRVAELGADHVFDREEGDWVRALKSATHGRGVDLAVDSVGEAMWPGIVRSLAVMGRVVCYGATTGPKATTDLRHLFWKQLSILGSTMGSPEEFREVMQLVFDGTVQPVIDELLPLERLAEAHERLEAGGVFGKIVLIP